MIQGHHRRFPAFAGALAGFFAALFDVTAFDGLAARDDTAGFAFFVAADLTGAFFDGGRGSDFAGLDSAFGADFAALLTDVSGSRCISVKRTWSAAV